MQKNKRKKLDTEMMDVDENLQTNDDNVNVSSEIDHISDDDEGGVRIGDIYIPPAPKPALSFETTGPRLIITQIVNENFKSYAGIQILGPFHKSFTAIIGPNGSGKSNVIDSMLFVFGYRASKIRSKKISVLIHSSSRFPNLTSATVAVHFCQIIDKEDDFEVVPNSEIIVSRTAFKDNSSHYTLNGKRVHFKEVGKMLRGHGIDLDHNRFLILQGEVEQIAMMKPKGQNEHESGMLEYLEDIIGTSRYKDPIEKLSVKVEEYSEMRKEKLNRVRLVEQEKQRLEQPMREAVELMNLTNVSIRTRNTLLQKYIHETNKLIDGKKKELQDLKDNLGKIDEKLKCVSKELKEKNATLKAGTEKYDKMKKDKDEISDKLQAVKKKSASAQSDIGQNNKRKKNLEQLLDQEKGKLIEFELVPEKNEREISECEKLLSKNTENKHQLDQDLQVLMASVRSKTQGFQETKDKLQSKLIGLRKIVDDSNKVFKLAESELKIYLSTEEKEQQKLALLKENYEKAVADLEEKKRLEKELTSKVPKDEKKLTTLQSKLQTVKNEQTTISRDINTLRAQVEESKQAMSANRSRGRTLDALMKAKRKGELPGIFGRLGDLGGIDNKYDVAISTCCGSLDYVVVDTLETAQACIEFLKRNEAGRATFLALDQQQHFTHNIESRKTYPEKVPRLFDLVKTKDDRVLPAFYFALRDTLVAKDLDQASRIAYGATRYRVVTLKGDVIEIAGTMTGGGNRVMRGRMSSSVQQDTSEHDPKLMQANENKLISLENRLSELKSEYRTLEESILTTQEEVKQGKVSIKKVAIDLKSLQEQAPLLKTQIKQQESKAASSKVDPKQKRKLEIALEQAQVKLDKARADAEEIEKEVREVDSQINAVAGNKVKDLQKNIDEVSKKIGKITAEITKLKVAINTSQRNVKKSKDKINQMQTDLKETESNIEKLNSEKKQLTLESSELQKKLEELQEQISEGLEEFKELRDEVANLQTKENKIKGERVEANNAVTKQEKIVQDFKSKTPTWEKELGTLKLEDPGIEGVEGIVRPEPLAQHTPEDLESVSVEELRNRLSAQKSRIGDAKPNIQAIQDYKTKEEVYLKRAAELDEITAKRNEMRDLHDQLRKKRMTDFLCGFNTITMKLKEMYQMITLGGDAELELVDSLDPFTEGIIFSVRPPNKSWKNISNLSGGEKTLSSLALVFALHYYRPTPLYVMDEIDAALDFKNVSIVANYIKDRTRNAQFIIISLRYNMFEASNRLVGIYKTEDCTKSVTIENTLPEEWIR